MWKNIELCMISPQYCPLWNAAVRSFTVVLMAHVSLSAGAAMETKIARTAVMRAIAKASRGRATPKPSSLAKAQVSASVRKERETR